MRLLALTLFALTAIGCGDDDDVPPMIGGSGGIGGAGGAAADDRVVQLGTEGELTAVAWTGSRFLVVSDDREVLRSSDGKRWLPHEPGFFSGNLHDVVWDGRRFFAVSGFGYVMATDDGTSFSHVSAIQGGELTAIAWSGSRFVAAGESATLLGSSDGIGWAPLSLPEKTYGTFAGAAQSADRLVVVGGSGRILALP